MIPDNYEIRRQYEDRMARRRLRFPKCSVCEERILDDYLFEINGELFCEECMKDSFRQDTDMYILEDEE
jgi:formylmethanofuran dehydrogenase subunit E